MSNFVLKLDEPQKRSISIQKQVEDFSLFIIPGEIPCITILMTINEINKLNRF